MCLKAQRLEHICWWLSMWPLNIKADVGGNLVLTAQALLRGRALESGLSCGDKPCTSNDFAGRTDLSGGLQTQRCLGLYHSHPEGSSAERSDVPGQGHSSLPAVIHAEGETTDTQLQGPVTSSVLFMAQTWSSVQAFINSQTQHVRQGMSKSKSPWKISGKRTCNLQ